MRLVTLYADNQTRIGVVSGDNILDLARYDSTLPTDMLSFLQGGAATLAQAEQALRKRAMFAVPLAGTRLAAPIPRPPKIVAIGLNYADHAAESGQPIPE